MGANVDKNSVMNDIRLITSDIDNLASQHSLATLDHKVKQRQGLLELLFSKFSDSLTSSDLKLLNEIKNSSSQLLAKMEVDKIQRGDEIIKHKNKGSRIRLYTNIAKHK